MDLSDINLKKYLAMKDNLANKAREIKNKPKDLAKEYAKKKARQAAYQGIDKLEGYIAKNPHLQDKYQKINQLVDKHLPNLDSYAQKGLGLASKYGNIRNDKEKRFANIPFTDKEKIKEEAKKYLKERGNKEIKKQIEKRFGKKLAEKGAEKVAKGAAEKAAKGAVRAGTKAAVRQGTQLAVKGGTVAGVEAGVEAVGAAATPATAGLSFLISTILAIAISLGVSDAIDGLEALAKGHPKEAMHLIIRACTKVVLFLVFLIMFSVGINFGGPIGIIPVLILFDIYAILGSPPFIGHFALMQGLAGWEKAVLLVLNMVTIIAVALMVTVGHILFCKAGAIMGGGLSGYAVDTFTSQYSLCKDINSWFEGQVSQVPAGS